MSFRTHANRSPPKLPCGRCATTGTNPAPSPAVRGFTLIELTAVILLVGVLAATTIPVLHRLRAIHDASLTQEVARRLVIARAHAMTTGALTGVRVNLTEQRLTFVTFAAGQLAEHPRGLAGDQALESDRIASLSGAAITACVITSHPNQINPGASVEQTIWFDYLGVPHRRTAPPFNNPGATPGAGQWTPLRAPAWIEIGRGSRVIVHPVTGHIGVQHTPGNAQ